LGAAWTGRMPRRCARITQAIKIYMSSSILVRVEKLRFIVEEMHVALHLTRHITEPFIARMLARHVIVRAENLIVHARALRKPLRLKGHCCRRL
jgi:hypothetical protein